MHFPSVSSEIYKISWNKFLKFIITSFTKSLSHTLWYRNAKYLYSTHSLNIKWISVEPITKIHVSKIDYARLYSISAVGRLTTRLNSTHHSLELNYSWIQTGCFQHWERCVVIAKGRFCNKLAPLLLQVQNTHSLIMAELQGNAWCLPETHDNKT